MPPGQKKFVKYTFQEGNNKPRDQRRPSESRQNFKQRDNNTQGRTRRHVSYTQKSSSKLNVLKDMINSFLPVKKPSPKLEQLMKTFPKFFNSTPKQPEPFTQDLLNGYLTIMGKRPAERQIRTFAPIDQESEEDPDWDSDSDVEGGIQSKKIDEQLIEKVKSKYDNVKLLRKDQLKRHEKQFLEDYYKQKHQQELEKQKAEQQKQAQSGSKPGSKQQIQGQSKSGKQMETGPQTPVNDWTEYQEKQVNEFINMGFIEKISQDENDFEADDFSVQDQKSQSASSSGQSSDGDDDDIFGDEGPTTIVKKKEVSPQSEGQQYTSQGTVVINSHVFSKIAEAVGIPPGACIWIIRNKNQRYKVSTQFMDEMYRLNNFCQSLPYVSLNHSQFVHNSDVQKDKGLQIFKKFNARKHQNPHQGHQNNKPNRNFVNNKRKFQYKPNPNQPVQKPHLNKK